MTVLVFGRSGQVATALVREAEARGVALQALGRGEVDVLDEAALVDAVTRIGATAVVNAAAYTAVDKAETERDAALALNARAPELMAKVCADCGLPFVHLSTDYVFDGSAREPYREDHPLAPLGVYGASKAEGERLVMQQHPQAIVLRTAWVYYEQGQNFVRTMLRLGRERDEVRVVDDQVGNPTYAADIAETSLAIVAQLQAGGRHAGVFHYAGRGAVSWFGFAQAIFAEAARAGRRVPQSVVAITTAEYPTPAKRPANSQLSCGRLEGAFGIAPKPWHERLQVCLERIAD
ncbi:dTDP-4-dehydrorhamnose reductase [Rhodopseudomonas palustris]|uniref:dTDP-4-dehydrorhamnose reductase n=1 Tax=Rhodopseudomonas palustris TaxID=1076 RepID=UPI0020CC4FA5|nr:dTDP-4-dehydrorhamnose reductase [Rhodopseudomonas palustris]MCP9627194.1 dTDP-4-dehydrorhamnose reductase [Rhodopseudomonas palustris]